MEIDVRGVDAGQLADILAHEREVSLAYQREGAVRAIWRVVGRYANYSLYDVADNDELHRRLSGLPLYPYMDIHVTALARHPNALPDDDPERP
jgi:muconolactone D-isomerase